ncbi:MAG: hypothetical protein M3P49_11455 [Actinomycetota bacterium]|nr:hypothetical protein [Actinomycetota bacterium]
MKQPIYVNMTARASFSMSVDGAAAAADAVRMEVYDPLGQIKHTLTLANGGVVNPEVGLYRGAFVPDTPGVWKVVVYASRGTDSVITKNEFYVSPLN